MSDRTIRLFERRGVQLGQKGYIHDYTAVSACGDVTFKYDETRAPPDVDIGVPVEPRAIECFAHHDAPNTCRACVEKQDENVHRHPAIITRKASPQ